MSTRKQFIRNLEKLAGEEDLFFVVPYPFLPPRLLKDSKQRNLLICVDTDMGISTRWEGTKLEEWSPLSPRAAYRLITEALGRMNKYAEDGFAFAGFLLDNGCMTQQDPGADDASSRREDVSPPLKTASNPSTEEEAEKSNLRAFVEIPKITGFLGGESPFPNWGH